ncbi:ABC transporter ATP-binding protein [Polaribacter atrinae]|uniref:ABC transporter n=1 Tax=Polaribacter atrinae TaxID=1333662 RepID=A0A176TE40_9FLAO|nr:ABC transporter ATP-binding protein [Polaribacter atrinae]OAD46140.1 ABC transporter [Polaribacter atrinae]
MSETILKIENLSKQYRLGLVGSGTMSDDLKRWWYKIRGKEDPFLKIGDVNNRSTKGESDYVWSLRYINFEVKKGEVLGIIGKNGAGKSTLLKILSKVTGPTTGSIKSNGRIASLLEVGTGFHPEMTGRENIFLNGAILGMTKKEIASKLDEIVEFSGCERYIDTPVKRYSSGMTVRLAFAVAAFLEPDILIIDEVLAVGDAEFQKKAIGKMQDISNTDGRTVLFVSHNMAAVKNLCTRCVVLGNGSVVFEGDTDAAVDFYLKKDDEKATAYYNCEKPNFDSDILEVSIINKDKALTSIFGFEEMVTVSIKFKVSKEKLVNKPIIGLRISDELERNIFTTQKNITDLGIKLGINVINVQIPNSLLAPNSYFISLGFHIKNQEVIRSLDQFVSFSIEETGTDFYGYKPKDFGCVIVSCKWKNI